MKKYKIEYWFRTKHDDMDFETVEVEADSEEDAIELAKKDAIRGATKFKIVNENNEFKRIQELAGVNETTKNESMIEGITNIIDRYSVGDEWIEIDTKDLSSMIEEIILYCKDEFSS